MNLQKSLEQAVEKKCWDDLQKELGDWADATFPNSSPSTILRHLDKDIIELNESGDPQEMADCAMLILHLAHKNGVSLRDEIRKKFEICKGRKWGAPDAEGVIHHIKSEELQEESREEKKQEATSDEDDKP